MPSTASRSYLSALLHFARARRGGIQVLLGLAIIPLVAMIGLAVDTSRGYLVKARLSQAVDAAALAGGRAFREDYRDEDVNRYFAANFPNGYMNADLRPLAISADESLGTIEVTAEARLPTTFMRVLGVETMPVNARSLVNGMQGGLELALVLDNTGSMSGDKIRALKRAARTLIDILYGDRESVHNLWVSLVPFTGRVNFQPNRDWMRGKIKKWNGCGDPRSGANATNDATPAAERWREFRGRNGDRNYGCPRTAVLPLTAEKESIKTALNAMGTGGNTRTDIGMVWGWRVLSPRWRGLWGDAEMPLDYRTPLMTKAAIVMTDGMNTPWLTDDGLSLSQTNAQLEAVCEAMKQEGIVLYTITFQAPADLDPLFRRCASSPANHFKSPTNRDLEAAFRAIGAQLSNLRLAQ